MEPGALSLAASAWGMTSALAIAALGLWTLAGGRGRPWGALPFGLFAVLWGLQVAFANGAMAVQDPSLAQTLYLLVLAATLPSTYFLVEFAASQGEVRARPRAWRAARVAAFVFPMAAAAALALAPASVYGGVVASGATLYPAWGPLFPFLVVAPFYGAVGLAMLALHQARRRAPTPRTAERAALMVAGLGLFAGFAAGYYLSSYTVTALAGARPEALPLAALFAVLAVLCAAVGFAALRHARAASDPAQRRREAGAALAVLVPLAWGLAEGALTATLVPGLQTIGLWRLAGVAVLAYGIARWRIHDLPERARRTAASSVGVAGAAAGGAAAYGTGALALGAGSIFPPLLGLLAVSMAMAPSVRLARGLLGARQATAEEDETRYGQRLEAYRAALEASMARGSLEDDRRFLEALRERFRITRDEDRVLRHLARSAVLLPRGGDAGAFERLRLLGEGGGGRTWLARDRAADRLVVLKEPLAAWQQDGALRAAVMREARLASRVRHPNVVGIEAVASHGNLPVLVMEYVDGGSLAETLRARGALPWREAVKVMLDVLRGLEAVHAAGVLHRDIKPANILLTADGTAKLADFGIARPARDDPRRTFLEGAPERAGTMAYLPPELRDGRAAWNAAADVYACAAVLHECLHGSPPGHAPARPRGEAPRALREALLKGLADDPGSRFHEARELAEVLRSLARA